MAKIGIIGAGPMGAATFKALAGHEVMVCDRNKEKVRALGVKEVFTDPNEMLPLVDVLFLAVKPQGWQALAEGLTVDLSNKLILSVMTGISLAAMQGVTGSARVIRLMPNLAVQLGAGVTGWVATTGVNATDRQLLNEILERWGSAVELEDEGLIDGVTGVSGSGPAYFLHMVEALQAAAEQMGFDAEQARLLAEGALMGAGRLVAEGERTAHEWREAITRPGGTTEAALAQFAAHGFEEAVRAAADAARQRSVDLSQ